MTNKITKKEYDKIKNKSTYAVVSFQDGKRHATYTALTITQAVREIQSKQKYCNTVLLIENLPWDEVSRNLEDYKKYIEAQ